MGSGLRHVCWLFCSCSQWSSCWPQPGGGEKVQIDLLQIKPLSPEKEKKRVIFFGEGSQPAVQSGAAPPSIPCWRAALRLSEQGGAARISAFMAEVCRCCGHTHTSWTDTQLSWQPQLSLENSNSSLIHRWMQQLQPPAPCI